MNPTTPTLKCPDCSYSTPSPQQLGRHRRYEHGRIGLHTKAAKRRKQKTNAAAMVPTDTPNPLQCPHCEFIAQVPHGLKHHITRIHQTRKETRLVKRTTPASITQTNGQAHQERQANPDGIPDALIAVTSGRFIEICRSVAFEYDLPPRLFAAKVAAFIYGTQVR